MNNWLSLTEALSPEALEAELRRIGAERYHNHHPFHKMLHAGELSSDQVKAWALNRYCYQAAIPIKDSSIMARMEGPELRREWRRRIVDHDGNGSDNGGIHRWLALTDGLGLDRDYVVSRSGALPATRFAVEAYIHFVREKTLLEAIASSLTELFSPIIISERVAGMLANYDFITEDTLKYFGKRLTQAPRDSDFALDYVRRHALRPDQQEAVLNALVFKCHVLWAQLDALYYAYVTPGHIAPGGYDPNNESK
jgi:coenzyme PQQ biosynthesis protein C